MEDKSTEKDREISKLWNQLNVLWRRYDQMKKHLENLETKIIETDERNTPLMEKEIKEAELESMEKEALQLISDAAKETKGEAVKTGALVDGGKLTPFN